MSADSQQLVEKIRSCLPAKAGPIALSEPSFLGREWEYVKECIDTGWVSSAGKYVDRFEVMLAEMTGARSAVATVNGTAALHVCLLLAGVRPGDEVLTPALTFVATTNAIAYCGAVPHFVDNDLATLGVDPARLDDYLGEVLRRSSDGVSLNRLTGRRVRALVAMHTFGHPVDLDPLVEVCDRYGLVLIEDAAEALGTYYKGAHVGHRGRLGALSFNGNKIVTTGGGGAILCDDPVLGKRAKHLTTTAKLPHAWRFDHDETGFNYRLPNINAALGCAQLEQLPGLVAAKRRLASRYLDAFAGKEEARIFREPSFARSNYWLNALLLAPDSGIDRDDLLERLHGAGIGARPVWTLQNRLPMYSGCPSMPLPVAESLERGIVSLPSSPSLAEGL